MAGENQSPRANRLAAQEAGLHNEPTLPPVGTGEPQSPRTQEDTRSWHPAGEKAAGTALRFRVGLVWYVAGVCLLSYTWLVLDAHWHRAQFIPPPKVHLPFVLSLGIMALIQHLLLRRIRRLDLNESPDAPREDVTSQATSGRPD